jgi:beta-glucosidase
MDASLSPDVRARLVQAQMTIPERLQLVRGLMALPLGPPTPLPAEALVAAGYVPGVPRLGVPALQETDGGLGVAYVMGLRKTGATALPSGLAIAASWSPQAAFDGGAMIGLEAHRQGFNVLLAGGANLARDPRGGRNFEYLGEDPLLTGVLSGETIRGIQSRHVLSTLKHFAFNDQETGRKSLDVRIAPAAARESDLLAFQLAIERGAPGAVMCGYNRLGGVYACENGELLDGVLKSDWRFPGWVMSDWGAVHGVAAALHGLDQESGAQLDAEPYFGAPLARAAAGDQRYASRLDDMTRRILRSLFAVGLFDDPPARAPIDLAADAAVAQRIAEQGLVLLANPRGLLPLTGAARRIAVIGGHADVGVLSGGGAAQVAPPEGPALAIPLGAVSPMDAFSHVAMYLPSAPYRAIKARAPGAEVVFDNGAYPSAAAALARSTDVAIVFATQWMGESHDAPDLSLPDGQDALIAAVAAANPNTIVVLETGGPVLAPWAKDVGAVIEAWYPGARGGEAIAAALFGDVNPSGRLPITFPAAMSQLPSPTLPGQGLPRGASFAVDYREGADVGYRWYVAQGLKPLFPFGHGLSYTTFAQSDLTAQGGRNLTVRFAITNTGQRAGADVAQVYLLHGPLGARRRLIGWSRVALAPGQSRSVTVRFPDADSPAWDAGKASAGSNRPRSRSKT